MRTLSFEVARIQQREVIRGLRDAGFDATHGQPRLGDGEAVVDVNDVADESRDAVVAVVRQHCPSARLLSS